MAKAYYTSSSLTLVIIILIFTNQEVQIQAFRPVYDHFPSPIEISENTPFGTKVFQCNATDADGIDTLAGQVRYYLGGYPSPAYNKWIIDSRTCELRTNTILNFETKSSYKLGIWVRDADSSSKPRKKVLSITIKDTNDHVPKCAESQIVVSIQEDLNIGELISTSVCTDGDVDKSGNGRIYFRLSASNDVDTKDKFKIDLNDGRLQLQQYVDYESRQFYDVKVDVYDGGLPSLTTTVLFSIVINDIDDNAPTWPENPIIRIVNELSALDVAVLLLKAEDADQANTEASTIKYGIKTKGDPDWFDIDREKGFVFVKGILNHLIAPWVALEVLAYSSDHENDYNVVTINISLTDENTIAPTFNQVSYHGSIYENSTLTTFVITVTATDPEPGANGEVEYFMSSPYFSIDSVSGNVTVNAALDFEMNNVYSLQIEARDKGSIPLKGYGFLLINILPVNEFDPVISVPVSDMTILEDAEPGEILFNVSATDADTDVDGIVTFSIEDILQPFTIEPTTGIFRVGSTLDRETQDQWKVVVIATDSSETSRRSSSTTVTINIDDVNDNNPSCNPLPNTVVTIPHSINGLLRTVICQDADTGINAELRYTKISGDDLDSFSVDVSSGEITLVSKPTETEYFITIFVQDNGSAPRSTTLIFYVIAELQFTLTNLPTVVNVSEHTIIQELYDVEDCCVFSLSQYEIISGNDDNHVIIDPSTGKLILMKSFDRETKQNFKYNIRATAIDTNSVATGYIEVNIDDYNDNAPKFDTNFQYISVSEDISMNSFIIQINALDIDIGLNSEIVYTISHGNTDTAFEIDSLGNIKLISKLDAEVLSLYSLVITATDNGDVALSSTTTVDINVLNVNDFSPQLVNISNGVIFTTASEDNALGAPIFSIRAEDQDIDTAFTYSITQGNDEKTFVIDGSSGDIYLAKILDRETTDQYNITVEVTTSNGEKVSALVVIDVLDVNDKDPKFAQDVYQLDVTHEDLPNKAITTFIITDDDIGVNKDIVSLTITDGDLSNHFKIVGNELQTNIQMNYYDRKVYSLTLKATDSGVKPRSGFSQVIINVLPIFKPPRFLLNDYSENVREDVASGDGVFDMDATAHGATEGNTGPIKYSIRSGNEDNKFYISDFSGIINVASNLDFESKEQHLLIIDAMSVEDPTLSASATVTLIIENLNDNVPVFSLTVYNFNIEEDSAKDVSVGIVSATDLDKGPITYRLETAMGSSDFSIDGNGLITVSNPLDYLRQNVYNIPVIADDGGVRNGVALVVIKIIDVNDNTPTFTPDTISIEVVESIEVGMSFYTVSAEDLDTGINGEITYTLETGNTNNQLSLDADSGVLKVESSLDRDSHDRFDLLIRATDKAAMNPKSGTLTLTVNVADINDNDPIFQKTLEDATINRSDPPGTHVLTVIASDVDKGDNAAIVYAITNGNTDGLFLIDVTTGEIKTVGIVTLAENEYNLEITAKDNGIPVRSDTMTVRVMIIPIKVFGPSEQTILIFEGLPATDIVPVVVKTGHDNTAVLKYSIGSGNFQNSFEINENTGMISTLKTLDREAYPSYILSVDITDDNGIAYTQTVRVDVRDINDNSPVITTTDTNIYVVENIPAGHIVAGFTVSDTDSDNNGKVDLLISPTPVEAREYFEISGSFLKTKKPLDYETAVSYTVNVHAVDRGNPKLTGSVVMSVTVIDVDDTIQTINGPRELPSIFISRETSFNSVNGDIVTRLTAEDFGKDSNSGHTRFTALNKEGIFNIDSAGITTIQKDTLLVAEMKYFVWVVATTTTNTNKANVLGLLRIDTFDPNIHIVSLESSADIAYIESKRNELIQSISNFFLSKDVVKIWKIQNYQINSRRKLLAAGSQILVYILEGPVPEHIADLEAPKTFKDMSELTDVLRMVTNQDVPQPSLQTTDHPIVAVNGYSEPVLPKTERSVQPQDDFVASTEGFITFGLLGIMFLIIVLVLFIMFCKKKNRDKRRNGSTENLVYTDPNTNQKKVAITIPKGTGKNQKDLPTNKTTRKISLGPAATSLPISNNRKRSTVAPPVPALQMTPVQSAVEKTSTSIVEPQNHKTSKGKHITERKSLPPPRKPNGTGKLITPSSEQSSGDNSTPTPKRKDGPVVHKGKEYDGVGFDNAKGKAYAYNTKSGSTLWEDKTNGLGTDKNIKKKAAPKLTVVSEARHSATPNLSVNRKTKVV